MLGKPISSSTISWASSLEGPIREKLGWLGREGRWARLGISSLFLLALSSTYGRNYWDTSWLTKWFALIVALSAYLAIRWPRRLFFLLPAFLSTTLSAFSFLLPGLSQYRSMGPQEFSFVSSSSAVQTAMFLFCVGAVSLSRKRDLGTLRGVLACLCAGATGIVLYRMLILRVSPFESAGYHGNASMMGCLIASTLPFLIERSRGAKWLLAPFPVLAILLAQTSVPLAALSLALLGMTALDRKTLRWVLGGVAVLGIGAYLLQGQEIFVTSGRTLVWRVALQALSHQGKIPFGFGHGTFETLFPDLQARAITQGDPNNFTIFFWAHSDIVQVLFEQGVVGFLSWLLVALTLFVRLLPDRAAFGSLAAYSVTSALNYPAHWAPTAFVGLSLLMLASHARDGRAIL